jgi:hypothetical protein
VGHFRGLESLALTCLLFPVLCYLPAHLLFRSILPPTALSGRVHAPY